MRGRVVPVSRPLPLQAAVDLIPPVDLDAQPSSDSLSDSTGPVREITLTDADRRMLDSLCPTRVPDPRGQVRFVDFAHPPGSRAGTLAGLKGQSPFERAKRATRGVEAAGVEPASKAAQPKHLRA